jgi:hypothetical protein
MNYVFVKQNVKKDMYSIANFNILIARRKNNVQCKEKKKYCSEVKIVLLSTTLLFLKIIYK